MTLILVALLVAQGPGDTDREKLVRLTRMRDCPPSEQELKEIVALAQAGLEHLPDLIQGDDDQLRARLHWYGYFAELKEPARVPTVILNLARSGTGLQNARAAEIALRIMDDRARAFLIEGLKRMAAGESTEMGNLERILLERAGWSHSEEAAKILLGMLDRWSGNRKVQIIDALGHLGYAPALDALKKLGEEQRPIPGRTRNAIEKIEYLASPECGGKLVEMLRTPEQDFPWRDWALDEILHRRLSEAADGIRRQYDELVKSGGPPRHGNDWRAKLLHGIHKVGGRLSPDELGLLKDLNRLPPAEPVKADAVELMKGFAEGIWAPHAERLKAAEAKNAPPPRITEDKLPKFMKERIKFVMNLKEPDPSYLAPNAALALETLDEMLPAEADPREGERLLTAYLYLARLREGMKTPEHILGLANGPPSETQRRAAAIVVTIADDRAEAWFLERFNGPGSPFGLPPPGRLSGPKVKEALVKRFKENERDRLQILEALVDRGCVEILPELKKMEAATKRYETRFAIERLEIFESPDRDARLLAFATSLARSGNFLSADWGLDQVLRLDLKQLAPDLRKWYDVAKLKWAPSHDPHRLIYKMPWVLHKLGAPITPEEEALLKRGGRKP